MPVWGVGNITLPIWNVMLVLWLGLLSGCHFEHPARLEPDVVNADEMPAFLLPLATAEKMTLFSIDGTTHYSGKKYPESTPRFGTYPLLGKIEITSAESRSEIVQALRRGTEDVNRGFAFCFKPRHVLRAENAGKTVDYVICFECSWIKVARNGEEMDIVTKRDAEEILNRHLTAAGIRIAP